MTSRLASGSPSSSSSRERLTGERRTKTGGYQTYVWRRDPTLPKGGRQVSRNWPTTSTTAERKGWRKEQQLRGTHPELFVEPDTAATTFAEDARDYLRTEKVQRMPTVKERTKHIEEWIEVFDRRERASIDPIEIKQALDSLLPTHAASSLNHRRTALMDLWTVLDGRHKANPVKAVPTYHEPDPEPRAPALVDVLTLLDGISTETDYSRKCRARLKVITWTGWPHAVIKQLEPSDRADWQKGRAYVRGRRKGRKGAKPRWLPLLPQAQEALREFHRTRAYGHFSNSSLWRKVDQANRRLKLTHIRPYDLRHFFGTLIATLTQDERAIMELMLVTSPKVIRRYTEAATNPRVRAAVTAVAKRVPGLLAGVRKVRKFRTKRLQTRSSPAESVRTTRRNASKSRKHHKSARSSVDRASAF
jgi:integrase